MASTVTTPSAPARVCRWYGGKRAALSLRFDDSHPTHATVALPLLNELGLIGTFLVCPGNASYQQHQAVWEGEALARGHELDDHTWNHRGAKTDADADQQIGAPAELLRRLQPDRGQVMFEPGGATLWLQRKPFAFFDAKYHLFDVDAGQARNVMSCSEVYSFFSVGAFRERLEKTIAEGDWFQPHFHQIDEVGHLRITPPVLRQVLEVAQAHAADLWQAGMTSIYEYQEERDNAAVWAQASGDDLLTLDLTCGTDPKLFQQPLTVEVDLPQAAATVTDAAGQAVPSRVEQAEGRPVLRFEVAPVDARYTVRATGLGAATRPRLLEIKAPGPHPYVLFTAAQVPGIMAKTSDPVAKEMWEQIVGSADGLTQETDQRTRTREWSGRIRMLAFAYAMTHKPEYKEAAIRYLEAFAADTSWYEENSEMLVTASAICTMGLAYDWMYDVLTEAQRAQLRAAIIEHGIKPILAETEGGDWWTIWPRGNWGSVIYGQAGVAALALLPEVPEAADWVRLSQRQMWHYLHSLGEDGSWGESASYAAYCWSNGVLFADALRNVTGYDEFDSPRLRKLPHWFAAMYEPGGRNFVPFSNCTLGNSDSAEILFRLAREYRDGQAQFVGRQVIARRGWYEINAFLWYDPTLAPEPLTELPRDEVFPGVSWAFLRSSWDDPAATLFALKGGQKDWDHNHHDMNSFALYAKGRPLLVDMHYPHSLWGCETQAHNTVMVNGQQQRGHVKVAGGRGNPDHRGVVGDLVTSPWYARVLGDASLAYEASNLTSFVREVMYLRQTGPGTPPDYFLMFDDIVTPTPSRIDWLLHSYGEVKTGDHGLTVTQDEAAVEVTLIAPERITSEVSEQSFEQADVPKPFDTAQSVKTITVRPEGETERAFFLSVLSPRAASSPAPLAIAAVREGNTLGADITAGEVVDRARFALEAPSISGNGIEAIGRSALVRTSGGQVVGAALHQGQRLVADGTLLFESDSFGHVVLTFGETGVEARLSLYNPGWAKVHVAKPPVKVWLNGREQTFEYEAATQCVTVKGGRIEEIRVQY